MIDVPRELVDLVEEHGFQSEWNALIDSIAELEASCTDAYNNGYANAALKYADRIAELEAQNDETTD